MKDVSILCFDCDGVIINNTISGYEKINLILKDLELPQISYDFLRNNWGMPVDKLCRSIFDEVNGVNNEQAALFEKTVKTASVIASLDPKLKAVLEILRPFGFLTAIITNRNRDRFETCAQDIGLDLKLFDYIQTISDHSSHKPDGDVFRPLLAWANIFSYTACNIAYFGDTINYDYQAVMNARSQGQLIKFVGVCSGVNTAEEFTARGLKETEIVPSHEALPLYLNKLIQGRVERIDNKD